MLRNDLITLMAELGNDTVTVDVNGLLVDVQAVTTRDGTVVLVIDPEGLGLALDWTAAHVRHTPR